MAMAPTGSRRTACPEHCGGWSHFWHATQTILHHELAIAVTDLIEGLIVMVPPTISLLRTAQDEGYFIRDGLGGPEDPQVDPARWQAAVPLALALRRTLGDDLMLTDVDLRVQFHHLRLPRRVWCSEWPTLDAPPARSESLRLDADKAVQRSFPTLERTVVGFRWEIGVPYR